MQFMNPANGYVEECSVPFLWALLFGPLYFVLKGIWRHVVLYLLVNTLVITAATWIAGGTLGLMMIADSQPADAARSPA